ncbi:MAG: sulfotransferase domain-containing protein [Robiginitomaculum sp.]|nr:sulfotransferase domain-containing protein [Robiginitomaculum sp.]MDQ7078548.1 sulfotransferase domain-containing protein [Robiginitomaculum sp.]
MKSQSLPQKTREYDQHPIIDGTRWRVYNHRPGDIIISTSYKAGTTWMQTIVANLLYQDGEFPAPVSMMAPWLDMALPPLDEVAAGLEAQTGRRFIKTHLPLGGIPFFEGNRYIVVGRDGRDVFMSLWNHHTNYNDQMRGALDEFERQSGRAFPTDYADIHELWKDWISKNWYEWESDGYPYWSHFSHIKTWWDYRHLPNIHFVHFADLLNNPAEEVRRIAAHLGITIDEDQFAGILERITFKGMKKDFGKIMPEASEIWKGGGNTFMNKGTNGRWRDVLSQEELAQYEAAVAKAMPADCAQWLEHGGHV